MAQRGANAETAPPTGGHTTSRLSSLGHSDNTQPDDKVGNELGAGKITAMAAWLQATPRASKGEREAFLAGYAANGRAGVDEDAEVVNRAFRRQADIQSSSKRAHQPKLPDVKGALDSLPVMHVTYWFSLQQIPWYYCRLRP